MRLSRVERVLAAPGIVHYWKGVLTKQDFIFGLSAFAVYFERVRSLMSKLGEWGVVAVGVAIQFAVLLSISRRMMKKHREAKAEKEAAQGRERERGDFTNLGKHTWHISYADRVHPNTLTRLAERAAATLVEMFVRDHPEGVQHEDGETTVDREMFMRWLVAGRSVPDPFPPLVKTDEE